MVLDLDVGQPLLEMLGGLDQVAQSNGENTQQPRQSLRGMELDRKEDIYNGCKEAQTKVTQGGGL